MYHTLNNQNSLKQDRRALHPTPINQHRTNLRKKTENNSGKNNPEKLKRKLIQQDKINKEDKINK